MPSASDAMLLTTGVPSSDLPSGAAVYRASRRVMKARHRDGDGARSAGFTIVCPSVRAPTLGHDEFDAHWRDNHAPIHIASSPGTCHYEHLVVDEVVTPGAPEWDGIGLLSFASADDYTERLFGGPAAEAAIFTDVAKFLDLQRGETIPTSEFVYRDGTRQVVTTGRRSHPRTVGVCACLACSQSTSQSGQRWSTSSSATRPSSRASAAPRQKCRP